MDIDQMKKVLLLASMEIAFSTSGQRINTTPLYRNVSSEKYFRLHYENDYFSTTDIYYTQGINLEYVHPTIGKFFTSRLLVHLASKEVKFGISLEHEAYTPTSISHSEILAGDRPFAAVVFFKTFSIANDAARRERVSSSLSAGAIGPIAGGKEIQETIHRWINYTQPLGWQNQIRHDIILNYQIDYERGLIMYPNHFSFSGKAGACVGSLNTKAYAGVILMAGYFDDPFENFSKQKKKLQAYLYAEPLLQIVGYDATLQGGLVHRASPYTISAGQISRWVLQGNLGLVVKINTVQVEYFQSYLTKEFETGSSHLWGGVRIGWYLNRQKHRQ
jgi:hypothetical protein